MTQKPTLSPACLAAQELKHFPAPGPSLEIDLMRRAAADLRMAAVRKINGIWKNMTGG
jgi:hypothetical protein